MINLISPVQQFLIKDCGVGENKTIMKTTWRIRKEREERKSLNALILVAVLLVMYTMI